MCRHRLAPKLIELSLHKAGIEGEVLPFDEAGVCSVRKAVACENENWHMYCLERGRQRGAFLPVVQTRELAEQFRRRRTAR